VVLADWHMPGMDGLATAKGIRAAANGRPQPIVVMLNAFARDRIEEISSAPEADVVLVKPITAPTCSTRCTRRWPPGRGRAAGGSQGIVGTLADIHFLLVEDNLLNQAWRAASSNTPAPRWTSPATAAGGRYPARPPREYDMVLMDMQMPVMDGFTATRILRQELGLSLPIIAMTAGVLESERERSRESGITDFIPKPIEVDEMLAVLRRHLPLQQPPPPTTARRRPPHRPRTPMPAEADLLAAMAAAASAGAGVALAAGAHPWRASAPPPKLVSSPMPTGEAAIFNMDGLMRVMGKDPRAAPPCSRWCAAPSAAANRSTRPPWRCRKGGCATPPAPPHCAARSACWAHGLIQATMAAETPSTTSAKQLDELYRNVRSELEQTLAQARAWLEREQS
jgi:CheY-like chemotaxis protein